jgi:hypothetical protein
MGYRKSVLAVCGAIIVLAAASVGHAWSPNRTTILTFSGPVELPGVALGSGSYIFELLDPVGNIDVVTVRDKDRTRVYYSGFTRRVERPAGKIGAVKLEETRPGMVPRILAWYPTTDAVGHSFVYSKGRE